MPPIQRTTVNGVGLAYEVSGDPGAPAVLFIHGGYGGPSSTLWEGSRLPWTISTEGLRCVAYDRRACGRSEYPEAPFALADIVRDARALLDRLDAAPAVVVGSSAGGPIALQLALDFPAAVQGLVLINTGADLMATQPTSVDRPYSGAVLDRIATVTERATMLQTAGTNGVNVAVAAYEAEWRALHHVEADPSLALQRQTVADSLRGLPDAELARLAAGALQNMRALLDIDLTPRLGELDLPVLVAHGDADTIVPFEYGAALARNISGAHFAPYAGLPHGLIVVPDVQQDLMRWIHARFGTRQARQS